MKIQGSIVLVGLACLIAAGSLMYGCGSNPTNPAPYPGPSPSPGPGSNTPFDSGLHSSGFVFIRTFPVAAGSVPYFCIPHSGSGMTGTVTVSASSSTDTAEVAVGPGGSLIFSPATVTVKVGGQVRWTWGSSGHTVTSGTPTAPGLRISHMLGTAAHAGH